MLVVKAPSEAGTEPTAAESVLQRRRRSYPHDASLDRWSPASIEVRRFLTSPSSLFARSPISSQQGSTPTASAMTMKFVDRRRARLDDHGVAAAATTPGAQQPAKAVTASISPGCAGAAMLSPGRYSTLAWSRGKNSLPSGAGHLAKGLEVKRALPGLAPCL